MSGFSVKATITDEDMRDLVTCGFESGCYGSLVIVDFVYEAGSRPAWADDLFSSGKPWPRYSWVWAVGEIAVEDKYGDGEKGVLTRETLQRGLQLLQDKYPKLYSRLVNDGGDALDADALLQAAAFGEVIYV